MQMGNEEMVDEGGREKKGGLVEKICERIKGVGG